MDNLLNFENILQNLGPLQLLGPRYPAGSKAFLCVLEYLWFLETLIKF